MKRKIGGKQNTRGEIFLESLIVYPITLFLLFFILAIFSVLFQRWNLQTVANDAAFRMAQTYRLEQADVLTGEVSEEQLTDVGIYRYIGNMFSHSMEESVDQRVRNYADSRLKRTTYTKSVNPPNIKTVVHSDALGRRHIEVTISGEYSVPFGQMLDYFGFGGTTVYEVKAYADCVDVIDYMNTVDYIDEQTNVSGKIVGLIDSVFTLIDNHFNK